MLDNILKLREDIQLALGQTAFMVLTSLAAAIVFGGLLGLLLYTTSNPLFLKNVVVNKIVGIILNVVRSVPFLILMILLLSLS